MTKKIEVLPLEGIGNIHPGDDLVPILIDSLKQLYSAAKTKVGSSDVLVIAQKIISKSEGRYVYLKDVTPSEEAIKLSDITGKDPNLVEVILSETQEVLRAVPGLIIVRDKRGFVLANAGIDRSNIDKADDRVLLLPIDADSSARKIRAGIMSEFGAAPAIIISDSFGRAWRMGTVNVAIGLAGFPAVIDQCGDTDLYGRELKATYISIADTVAGAAGLVMGEAAEGKPAALIRGLEWTESYQTSSDIVRPLEKDLFT